MYAEYHMEWPTFQLKATQKSNLAKRPKYRQGFFLWIKQTQSKEAIKHISEKNPNISMVNYLIKLEVEIGN